MFIGSHESPLDLVVHNLCISFAFLFLVFLLKKLVFFGIEIFNFFFWSFHHLHLVVSTFGDIARKAFPSCTHLFFSRLLVPA